MHLGCYIRYTVRYYDLFIWLSNCLNRLNMRIIKLQVYIKYVDNSVEIVENKTWNAQDMRLKMWNSYWQQNLAWIMLIYSLFIQI